MSLCSSDSVVVLLPGGGGGGGMSHGGLYIIRVNHFLKSTLNEDEVLGNFDTLYLFFFLYATGKPLDNSDF